MLRKRLNSLQRVRIFVDMEKKKEFWNRLRIWQRGGLIGFLLGLLLVGYVLALRNGYFFNGNEFTYLTMFNIIPLYFSATAFSYAMNESLRIPSIITMLLWYSVIGIIISQIYSSIRFRFKKKQILVFIAVFVSVIILIILANFLILGYIFSGAN